METSDLSSALTRLLASILEDCKKVDGPLNQYLISTEERPQIHLELLRILTRSIEAFEWIEPARNPGEFPGLLGEEEPPVTIRHKDRPSEWDFKPWLSEKLGSMRTAAVQLSHYWLTDLATVQLRPGAPLTPQAWLSSMILMHFHELKAKAQIVFEEVCSDRIEITPENSAEDRSFG